VKPLDIEATFQGFMKQAYPFGVHATQMTESRRVFYAGIHALLSHMLTFEDATRGDAELERLLGETRAFAKKVGDSIHLN
jgi:hypothetical protein